MTSLGNFSTFNISITLGLCLVALTLCVVMEIRYRRKLVKEESSCQRSASGDV